MLKMNNVSKVYIIGLDNKKWAYKDNQIYNIKDKNIVDMYKFFKDNFKNFLDIAKRYNFYIKKLKIEDLIFEIFINLPYFRFDSDENFLIDIQTCIECFRFGRTFKNKSQKMGVYG